MDTTKCTNRLRGVNSPSFRLLVKKRIIESFFTLVGYYLTKGTSVPTVFGMLLGGLCGMIIAQALHPTSKLSGKLDAA